MDTVIQSRELAGVFVGGQANEALHSGQFEAEGAWGESPALKRASQVAGGAWERFNALHDLRVNKNPEAEPAVHARKLKRLVDEASAAWSDQWQDAKNALKLERQRTEAELRTAANLKANPAHFNAIVGTFSGLKQEQRMAAIEQAIAEGDGPTLQTLIEAPSLVTGLSAEQRESIKAHVFEKANPKSHALLKALDKALVRAEAASLAAIDATQKLAEGTTRFDAKVEHAKALESKVRSGFAT